MEWEKWVEVGCEAREVMRRPCGIIPGRNPNLTPRLRRLCFALYFAGYLVQASGSLPEPRPASRKKKWKLVMEELPTYGDQILRYNGTPLAARRLAG